MVTEAELFAHVDEFSEMIKDTQEYKDYMHMVEVLQRTPELFDRVMVFRKENYMLQHAPESRDINERVADLRRNNAELLETPEVYDYLMAEWSFFHLVQSLYDRIMNEVEFI